MNIVATDFRSRLLVSNISDILFVRLNGPLPHTCHTWNSASATRSWLLKGHRQADDTRSKILNKPEQSSPVAISCSHTMTGWLTYGFFRDTFSAKLTSLWHFSGFLWI